MEMILAAAVAAAAATLVVQAAATVALVVVAVAEPSLWEELAVSGVAVVRMAPLVVRRVERLAADRDFQAVVAVPA